MSIELQCMCMCQAVLRGEQGLELTGLVENFSPLLKADWQAKRETASGPRAGLDLERTQARRSWLVVVVESWVLFADPQPPSESEPGRPLPRLQR